MDKLLNLLFWLGDVFSHTTDPVLAEYRSYQKQMIASLALVFLGLVGDYLVTPSAEPVNSLHQFVYVVQNYVGLAFSILAVGAALWGVWIGVCAWRKYT